MPKPKAATAAVQRIAMRKWVYLRYEITADHLRLSSPAYFDKYLSGRKLEVIGTDDFYYIVKDPGETFGTIRIHTNWIVK